MKTSLDISYYEMCNGPPSSMDSVTRWAARTAEPSTPAFSRYQYNIESLLRIRIRRIHMFLGLLDLDPLVRGTDPDPSIHQAKILRKPLIPTVL